MRDERDLARYGALSRQLARLAERLAERSREVWESVQAGDSHTHAGRTYVVLEVGAARDYAVIQWLDGARETQEVRRISAPPEGTDA